MRNLSTRKVKCYEIEPKDLYAWACALERQREAISDSRLQVSVGQPPPVDPDTNPEPSDRRRGIWARIFLA